MIRGIVAKVLFGSLNCVWLHALRTILAPPPILYWLRVYPTLNQRLFITCTHNPTFSKPI